MNKALMDDCDIKTLQRLKDIWYTRMFEEQTDGQDEIPLHIVCHKHTVDLKEVKLLTSSEEIRAHDECGRLLLHVCCCNKGEDNWLLDLEAIRMLVAAYSESVREKDVYGQTPLYQACCNHLPDQDNSDVIRFLAKACPESVYE